MRLSNDLKRRKDLTANAKLVYTHMLDKYVFFSRQEKSYHENMQDIADELGMAKRTVGDCVKNLETAGLLTIFKRKVYATEKSVISYSYILHDFYGIYAPAKVVQIRDESPF
jgi:DNA-binding MarR family transcriptional regulator